MFKMERKQAMIRGVSYEIDDSQCDLKINVSLGSDVLGDKGTESSLWTFAALLEEKLNENWVSALVSVDVRDSAGFTRINVTSRHPQLDEEETEDEVKDLIDSVYEEGKFWPDDRE